MDLIVSSGFAFDVLKLTLYIACAYLALAVYARHAQTGWRLLLPQRRLAVLMLLTLMVVGIKVFEDVVAKESGPIDTAVLWFIRQNMPASLIGFFSAVTLTGAGVFLAPATLLLSGWLLVTRHRHQSVLLTASMASGWLLTYGIKAAVNRPRPELWSSAWYWGASFPSGHTLSTAVFATAVAIGAAQIWPRSRYAVVPLTAAWIVLMGLSRLVLGVHWPTDVLAAICLGVFIPLAIAVALDVHSNRSTGHS